MCAFIFLNPLADFPPIFKLLFQQISPTPLQEKQETRLWLFFLSWTSSLTFMY